jgi:hypothetical protein
MIAYQLSFVFIYLLGIRMAMNEKKKRPCKKMPRMVQKYRLQSGATFTPCHVFPGLKRLGYISSATDNEDAGTVD